MPPIGSYCLAQVKRARIWPPSSIQLTSRLGHWTTDHGSYFDMSVAIDPTNSETVVVGADAEECVSNCACEDLARRFRRDALVVPVDGMGRLLEYDWPGNVRELLNVLERAAILCLPGKASVSIESLQRRVPRQDSADSLSSLEELERRHIQRVLEHTRGRIYGVSGAAEILKLKPSTLQSRMVKLGIVRPTRQQ